jgi:hypothetical protein
MCVIVLPQIVYVEEHPTPEVALPAGVHVPQETEEWDARRSKAFADLSGLIAMLDLPNGDQVALPISDDLPSAAAQTEE